MSQFNLFGCDGRRFVWCSPKEWYSPQCTKSSVKYGRGSVMVFSMISTAGTRLLVRLHGKINATVYKEILKKHVPNLRTAINQPAVSMKDNALCYTEKSVKTFLSEEDVTIMKKTAHSPDMNPIENVLKLLNERAMEKNTRNIEELCTNLKGEWEEISVDECKILIRSCSKRYQAVIESKGLYIKY